MEAGSMRERQHEVLERGNPGAVMTVVIGDIWGQRLRAIMPA